MDDDLRHDVPSTWSRRIGVEQACDRFEAAWMAGQRPRIEDALAAAPEPVREELRRELLVLELIHRTRGGDVPTPGEYRDRFPGCTDDVDRAFLDAGLTDEGRIPDGTTRGPGGTNIPGDGPAEGGSSAGRPRPRFRKLRFHARGGLGEVFVAWDEELGREVALKQIQDRHADYRESRDRFVREAKITGGLEHPGIVPVYALEFEGGRPRYAMRFIGDETLRKAIASHHGGGTAGGATDAPGLEFRKLLGRFVAVCETMAYAHNRGVIHRDLKPANIMLGPYGETLVVDWGLAKRIGGAGQGEAAGDVYPPGSSSDGETRTGSTLGTVPYMSPEQAAGELDRVGTASDVYSLGATLYCLLTGRTPFPAPQTPSEQEEVIRSVKAGAFPPPRSVDRSVAPALEAICLKAMALEPEDRYASPKGLAADVEHWLADEPVAAHREGWPARLARRARRHRTWVRAGAAALLMVTLVSVAAFVMVNAQRRQVERLRAEDEIRQGQDLCERGDVEAGMLRLARVLGSPPLAEAPELRHDVRVMLAGWRRRLPALVSVRPFVFEEDYCAVAFSPDGKTAVAAVGKNSLVRWDVATGRTSGPAFEDPGQPIAVAFSPDGRFLLAGGLDGKARLWETDTGKLVATFPHEGDFSVKAVAFSPKGRTVLTGGGDTRTKKGEARLWDPFTGKPVGEPLRHESIVNAAAFSPDGETVLTGSGDRTARRWDAARGKLVREFMDKGKGSIIALAFSPDGKMFVTGSFAGTARLWDVSTGEPVGEPLLQQNPVYSVAFSRDGKVLLTGGGFLARFWDVATREAINPPLRHHYRVRAVAFSRDGRRIVTGAWNGQWRRGEFRLWEMPQPKPSVPLDHKSATLLIAFSPDGKTVLTGGWREGDVRLMNAATGRAVGPTFSHDGAAVHVGAFGDGGRTVLTSSGDHSIRIFDATTGRLMRRVPFHDDRVDLGVAFSADGKTALVGTHFSARLWDLTTGRPIGEPMPHYGFVAAAAFSPDGRTVLTGSADGSARLWEVPTGRPIGEPFWHQGAVRAVAFSRDGKSIATGGEDRTARRWDLATGRPSGPALPHRFIVYAVAFGPDGRALLTGSGDEESGEWDRPWWGEARVWEADSGRLIGPPLPFRHHVNAVAFSPDGQRFATGSEETVGGRLWEVETPVEGTAERLALWAQVITGMELDPYDTVRLLDSPTWQQRRLRLEELGGPPPR